MRGGERGGGGTLSHICAMCECVFEYICTRLPPQPQAMRTFMDTENTPFVSGTRYFNQKSRGTHRVKEADAACVVC
jgi:hypothetical protein